MASVLYPAFKASLLAADLDLLADDIRVVLVDAQDYTYSSAHDFLNDVPSGARVAASGALTGKTGTGGVFDADNVTFTAVTGDPSEALILYRHTGADATANLIAYIDTVSGGAALSVSPNTGDITVTWNASGIFAL